MSKNLGKAAQDKIVSYARTHLNPKSYGMKPALRLRLMIGEAMFQAYSSGRASMTTQPIRLARTISDRVYRTIIQQAPVNPDLAELAELILTDGSGNPLPRSYGELTNDVTCYEILRSNWGVDTRNHDKALYKEGAYSLIEMGLKSSDSRALSGGMDRLAKVNNDFQEEADDYANTASADVDFISDVQIVRPDAENISRTGIEDFKRKYNSFIDKRHGGVDALLAPSDDDDSSLQYDGDFDTADDADFFESEQERIRQERE